MRQPLTATAGENCESGMERFLNQRVNQAVNEEYSSMVQKLMTAALITASLVVAACNTVHGAASDVNSVANCTENAMNGGKC
jgi:entericidin B